METQEWYRETGKLLMAQGGQDLNDGGLDMISAAGWLEAEDFVNAGAFFEAAGLHLQAASLPITAVKWGYPDSDFCIWDWMYLEEQKTVTITMDAIISAMLTASKEQLTYFIGLVDAYRVAIWNDPFNAEFYAALARGFML